MHEHGIADSRRQLFQLHAIGSFLVRICLPVSFPLPDCLLPHLASIAGFEHVLGIFTPCDVKLNIGVIPPAILLLKLCRILRIIDRLAEIIGNVLLESFVGLGRITGKGDAQMALVQHLTAILCNMLAIAKGHPAHRSHVRLALPPFPEHRKKRQRMKQPAVPARELRSVQAIGKVLLQRLRQMLNDPVCVQIRSQLNLIQQLAVHQIRQSAVLSQRSSEMSHCNRQKALTCGILQREFAMHGFHLVQGVLPPKIWENRPHRLLLLIRRILQRQPEQAFIDALIDGFVEGVVEGQELPPVVVQMNGADNAVPVYVCFSVGIVDAKAGLNGVIVRAVPDQIGRSFFFEFCDFHVRSAFARFQAKTASFPRSPGNRTVIMSLTSCRS